MNQLDAVGEDPHPVKPSYLPTLRGRKIFL